MMEFDITIFFTNGTKKHFWHRGRNYGEAERRASEMLGSLKGAAEFSIEVI